MRGLHVQAIPGGFVRPVDSVIGYTAPEPLVYLTRCHIKASCDGGGRARFVRCQFSKPSQEQVLEFQSARDCRRHGAWFARRRLVGCRPFQRQGLYPMGRAISDRPDDPLHGSLCDATLEPLLYLPFGDIETLRDVGAGKRLVGRDRRKPRQEQAVEIEVLRSRARSGVLLGYRRSFGTRRIPRASLFGETGRNRRRDLIHWLEQGRQRFQRIGQRARTRDASSR